MKKLLLLTPALLFILNIAHAQWGNGVIDGEPLDSITFSFEQYDSLINKPRNILIDTTGCTLWQIGYTNKPYFSSGSGNSFSIMTDTSLPYPINANDWFVLKLKGYNFNTIVSFWHKYQTDSLHDGCILEYSIDTGITWNNVKGDCNIDSGSITNAGSGVLTTNVYKKNDTLLTGEQAFSGNSNGWQYSRVQFFEGFPLKTTGPTKTCIMPTVYLRFRFVSDSIADTLDGWMIDSIKVEHDKYYGAVSDANKHNQLSIHPNPTYSGIIYFPELKNEQAYKTEILDPMGKLILSAPYKHKVDLSNIPKGMYYYKVSSGEELYTGHLLLE